LSLGLMAHELAASSPAQAAGIVRWALAELESARTAAQRRQMLLVLGNTGSAHAWPALRAHLSASESEVRGAAVAGLRWLESAEAEEALCRALAGDADAGVRLEAAQALEERRPSAATVAALARALRQDGAVPVRLAALRGLARARAEHSEAEAA